MQNLTYYTHSGRFHADEVFGYAICKLAEVCSSFERVTDLNNIPQDGLIVDIGREYSPEKLKFDHHQGFITRENGFPLASAGMLWKHYGENICGSKEVADRVDITLIQGIDANDADNSFSVQALCSAGEVQLNHISGIISAMNGDNINNHEAQNALFIEATNLASMVLNNAMRSASAFVEAKQKFNSIVEFKNDKVAFIPEMMPWREIVHENNPELLYVITPSSHPGSPFSLIAVSITPTSRELKLPIERMKGFEGFIHQGKWIAGCQSKEQAIALANFNISTQ